MTAVSNQRICLGITAALSWGAAVGMTTLALKAGHMMVRAVRDTGWPGMLSGIGVIVLGMLGMAFVVGGRGIWRGDRRVALQTSLLAACILVGMLVTRGWAQSTAGVLLWWVMGGAMGSALVSWGWLSAK